MTPKQSERLEKIQKDHPSLAIYKEDEEESIVCIYLNILLINIFNFILHIFFLFLIFRILLKLLNIFQLFAILVKSIYIALNLYKKIYVRVKKI